MYNNNNIFLEITIKRTQKATDPKMRKLVIMNQYSGLTLYHNYSSFVGIKKKYKQINECKKVTISQEDSDKKPNWHMSKKRGFLIQKRNSPLVTLWYLN